MNQFTISQLITPIIVVTPRLMFPSLLTPISLSAAAVAKFQASEYIKYRAVDDAPYSKFDTLVFRFRVS